MDDSEQHLRLRVRINVSGKKFECFRKTLCSKPGSIFHDTESVQRFYCRETSEYTFYRDYHAFEAIFVYLQCGLLFKPKKISFKTFVGELVFYGFRDRALELYNKELTKVNSIIHPQQTAVDEDCADQKQHMKMPDLLRSTPLVMRAATLVNKGGSVKKLLMKQGVRAKLNDIFDKPDTNIVSRLLSVLTILVIFLSIFAYCLATYPGITKLTVQRLDMFEYACNLWFTIELAGRFLLTYNKRGFLKNFINIIDLVSIVPFYMEMLTGGNEGNYIMFSLLRMIKVTRVFRILKVSRYSVGMHIVIMTVRASLHELSVLFFFIFTTMVFFASLIYQFEFETMDNGIISIPHAFWLVIITITTVGYGDVVPTTSGGRLITSTLMVTGIILIALPIPIVVNNFRNIYEKVVEKRDEYFFDFDELRDQVYEEFKNHRNVENDDCKSLGSNPNTTRDMRIENDDVIETEM